MEKLVGFVEKWELSSSILSSNTNKECQDGRGYPPGNLNPPFILSNHQWWTAALFQETNP